MIRRASGTRPAARSGTGPLHRLDLAVARQLNAALAGNHGQIGWWRTVSAIGGPTSWRVLAGIVALVLWRMRRRDQAILIAITMAGAAGLSGGTKALIGRNRPTVAVPVHRASGKSFPSGHALTSLVAVGLLVLLWWPVSSPRQRILLLILAILLVAAIGFSRPALGVHYLTDVLGGWLIGTLWLLGCWMLFGRRQAGHR